MSILGSIKQLWRVGAAASFERAGSCRWKRWRGECSERITARYFTTSHCGREITTKSKWGVAESAAIEICFVGLFIEPARGARGGGLGSNVVPCRAWLLCI